MQDDFSMHFALAVTLFPLLVITALLVFAVYRKKSEPEESPKWEVQPVYEGSNLFPPIGYVVRWSEPDDFDRYLYVGHYYCGDDLSIGWCENAAERHAKDNNLKGKVPQDFEYQKPV